MKRQEIVDTLYMMRDTLYKKEKEGSEYYGLCYIVDYLYLVSILKLDEAIAMANYLSRHKPIFTIFNRNEYWWPKNEIEPRLRWIRRRIIIEKIKIKLGFDYFEILFSLLKFW